MSEQDELREHSFDGIQEYDNDLPRWWVWLFWVTIIFSAVYPFVFDFGPAEFASESIDREMAEHRQAREALVKASGAAEFSEESLVKLAADSEALKKGAEIFTAKCLPCHGPQGQGIVGPNLTDDYWIHGGSILDVHRIIANGVIEKGMLPWKDQLPPSDISAVAAYVWTLHGTNPPNPKTPEGQLVQRQQ